MVRQPTTDASSSHRRRNPSVEQPDEPPVLGYQFLVADFNQPNPPLVDEIVTQPEFSVTGLETGRLYIINVTAINRNRNSITGFTFHETFSRNVVTWWRGCSRSVSAPGPPRSRQIRTSTRTSAQVQWREPAALGQEDVVPVLRYRVVVQVRTAARMEVASTVLVDAQEVRWLSALPSQAC